MLAPGAASSRRRSGWDVPNSAEPSRPPSPALAVPPRRSSPSTLHRSSVSFSGSWSAPSSSTEQPRLQLTSWSQKPSPVQSPPSNALDDIVDVSGVARRDGDSGDLRRARRWLAYCEAVARIVSEASRREGGTSGQLGALAMFWQRQPDLFPPSDARLHFRYLFTIYISTSQTILLSSLSDNVVIVIVILLSSLFGNSRRALDVTATCTGTARGARLSAVFWTGRHRQSAFDSNYLFEGIVYDRFYLGN